MIRKIKTGLFFSLMMTISSCSIGALISSCDTNDNVTKCGNNNCPSCQTCNQKPPILEPVIVPDDVEEEKTRDSEKVSVTINNNVDTTAISESEANAEANAKNVVMTYTKQLNKKCLAHYRFKEIECDKTVWCDTPAEPPKPPKNPPEKPKKPEFPGKQKKCVSKGTYQQQSQQKVINFTENGCGGDDTEILFF